MYHSLNIVVEPEISAVVPSNRISKQGEKVTLMCLTVRIFIDSFKWEKNGSIVGNNQTLEVIVDASSGGIYTCTVTNAAGTDSEFTALYVEPFINRPLSDQTLALNGSSVDINCDAAGFPAPNVSWINASGLEISNSLQLQFSPVVFGDEGVYTCVLTAEVNGMHFSAIDETTIIGNINIIYAYSPFFNMQCTYILFTVSPEGSAVASPSILISSLGDTVRLTCTAMGGPNNTFQWVKNGITAGNDSVLDLMTVNASYGGDYSCIVSNAAGADSASTTLYVAPYIITPLQKEILARVDGSGININCPATGFPAPTVNWVDMLDVEVSSTSLLLLNPLAFGDEGLYRCIASADINGTNFTAVDETTVISKIIFAGQWI